MKPLHVLSVAYPFSTVGPDSVGGAEQVLSALDRELVKKGYRSTVIAAEGSRVHGSLLPISAAPPGASITADRRSRSYREVREAIVHVLSRAPVDVVHFHGIDFPEVLPPAEKLGGVPALVTLHLPLSWYPEAILREPQPGVFFNCVSESQMRIGNAEKLIPRDALLPAIPNGVDTNFLGRPPLPTRKRFDILCIGRICPEKGYHLALKAAHRSGASLLLAGHVFPYEDHQRYFETEIRPRLDPLRRFVGPAGPRAKRRLLASARCLAIPSLVPETASLVAMEALACGTPVISLARGALPDVIEHGRTGFLAKTEHELEDTLVRFVESRSPIPFAPERITAVARDRFELSRTLRLYREAYNRICQSRASDQSRVRTPSATKITRETEKTP